MNLRNAGIVVQCLVMGCATAATTTPLALSEPTTQPPADAGIERDGSSLPARATMPDVLQWMEEPSARLTSWLDEQNRQAREVLDQVSGVEEIRARVSELRAGTASGAEQIQVAGSHTFFLRRAESTESASLIVRESSGQERILVNPNVRGTLASHASISFAVPSADGRYVAYGLAFGDSEDSTLSILDVTSNKDLPETISGARFATPSWTQDRRSFAYTRVDADGTDKRTRVYIHRIGTNPAKDIPIFGHDVVAGVNFVEADRTYVYVDPTGPFYVGWVQHGTAPDISIYVSRSDKPSLGWRRFASPDDRLTSFTVSRGSIFAVSSKDAPRARIVRRSMLSPNSSFDVVVPESDAFVRDVSASSKAVYVLEQLNGRGTVRALSFDEKPVVTEVKLPVDGPVRRLVADPLTANALVEVEGWTQASTWFYVDARGRASNARLPVPSVGSLPGVVAEEELVSNAGIQVPLTVVRRKDIPLDGSAPTLLLGYGAYGTSVGPYFAPAWLAWLERGGIFAVAHVRGGGERGETWHRDGMLSKKQNGIDDFLACAQYLVQNHYTSSAKLVAFAVSAGGVLAGSAIVQRPELFGAAVLESALCNPLRLDHMALGPQNAAEFGSASSEDGYRTLLAIDPYMQVRESARYPRVLFLVGANDTRVPPWQSAKFAARLQASGGDGADSLLRVYADEGHGVAGAASVRARMIADEYAFGFLATSGVIPKRMNEPKSRD